MSNHARDEASDPDPVLSSQTICAFADELFRLAKDIKNLVASSIASPRVLSNLTAMKPIISLLSDQGYSTILNPQGAQETTELRPKQSFGPAGYL